MIDIIVTSHPMKVIAFNGLCIIELVAKYDAANVRGSYR